MWKIARKRLIHFFYSNFLYFFIFFITFYNFFQFFLKKESIKNWSKNDQKLILLGPPLKFFRGGKKWTFWTPPRFVFGGFLRQNTMRFLAKRRFQKCFFSVTVFGFYVCFPLFWPLFIQFFQKKVNYIEQTLQRLFWPKSKKIREFVRFWVQKKLSKRSKKSTKFIGLFFIQQSRKVRKIKKKNCIKFLRCHLTSTYIYIVE